MQIGTIPDDSPASTADSSPAAITTADNTIGLRVPLCPAFSEDTTVTTSTACTEREATDVPVDRLSQFAMGNGLVRGRHRKGELPIPLSERIRQLPKHPSSLQLDIPDVCYSESPSTCHSLNSLEQDFGLNGLNGNIGLSKDFLCVPGGLQEVKTFTSFIPYIFSKTEQYFLLLDKLLPDSVMASSRSEENVVLNNFQHKRCISVGIP